MSTNSQHERNQARGYKAAIHNPNVSEEAKQNAQQRLGELGYFPEADNTRTLRSQDARHIDDTSQLDEIDQSVKQGKNEGNVVGGYKAVLKNPNVSDEAKAHAEEVLEEHDALN